MEVANESCLRWARGAATVQVRVLFDCCKRREQLSAIVLFNNPALRCLSASTGTDFELVAQSRTEENVEEKYKAEQTRVE